MYQKYKNAELFNAGTFDNVNATNFRIAIKSKKEDLWRTEDNSICYLFESQNNCRGPDIFLLQNLNKEWMMILIQQKESVFCLKRSDTPIDCLMKTKVIPTVSGNCYPLKKISKKWERFLGYCLKIPTAILKTKNPILLYQINTNKWINT